MVPYRSVIWVTWAHLLFVTEKPNTLSPDVSSRREYRLRIQTGLVPIQSNPERRESAAAVLIGYLVPNTHSNGLVDFGHFSRDFVISPSRVKSKLSGWFQNRI